MRTTFIQRLEEWTRQKPSIQLVVGDLGFSVVEEYQERHPHNFINAGVAEQNMTGLAAGMASEGCHVFTYSIANFPTFRCAEQIRNDVDYHNLPVTVVVVGGGVAYGPLGYSHHAVQDYALMRMMPNMLIAAPGDPREAEACLDYLIQNPQPSYLRLGKNGEPIFHSSLPEVKPGRWCQVAGSSGGRSKVAIVSTGAALGRALVANETLDYDVYTLPLWGMNFKESQLQYLEQYDTVFTIEDHLTDGGFGSWMLEANLKNRHTSCTVIPLGLSTSVCGMVGKQDTLMDQCLDLSPLFA